jgi:ATP-dependent helicase/nuclease subunit A
MADHNHQPSLTEEQRRAIETRRVSVALSAGAGCGKTFVLTRRFLSHLEGIEPEQLSRFVAITFTDRAAREMRGRIREACREQVVRAAHDAEADRWLRIYRELESARISTFHSFCGSLLRAHAVEAGLDPSFQTLDEAATATLRSEFLDERLRQLLSHRDEHAMRLAVAVGLEGLRQAIATLLGKRQTIDFAAWQSKTADDLLDAWEKYYRETIRPTIVREFVEGEPVKAVLGMMREHTFPAGRMRDQQAELLRLLPKLADGPSLVDDLRAIRENAGVKAAGVTKAWDDESAYAQFRDAAKELRDEIDAIGDKLDFNREEAGAAAQAAMSLISIAGPIADGFAARKRELNCLDFDDLMTQARRLLEAPANADLRRRLSDQIKLLLVDESQDTDPVQIGLIEALCGESLRDGKLFFVGDFKQSIYRFRGANPAVFRDLRGKIPADGQLPLTLNFRSQPAILNFVNALFCDALPNYEPLRAHRPQATPEPAIEFIWAVPPSDDGHKIKAEEFRPLEADWIARRLKHLIDSEAPIVCDKKLDAAGRPVVRPIKPGDIAILFRALSDVAVYEAALREHGIDYYLVGGKAFYAQQEVFDLLNLLRCLDSPCDQVSLAGALRSPFFGLTDETLFWLSRDGSLAAGLFGDAPKQLTNEQKQRVAAAAGTLRWLRARKDRVPIADLIHDALSRTGYDAILLAEFMGERKLANLRKLIDDARAFDLAGLFTLADYIAQLSEFVAGEPAEPLAATHPEDTDVVRLMTIHQSKGLEFPVVVVPDIERKPPPGRETVAFHPELGPMIALSGDHGDARSGIHLLRMAAEKEEQEERLRLFYVATTRAADYLILSAGLKNLEDATNPWRKLLSERFDLNTGALKAALPAGYEAPQVLVTTTAPPLPRAAGSGKRRRPLDQIVAAARTLAADGGVACPPYVAAAPRDEAARRQFSFSGLKGLLTEASPVPDPAPGEAPPLGSAAEDEEAAAQPSQRKYDPLELGTLVHAALAVMPFTGKVDVDGLVRGQAERRGGVPPNMLADAIDLVGRFAHSGFCRRLADAKAVHREIEFLLSWPPEAPAADGTRMQGVIDCLYQDSAGDWHLVDYKTNETAAENVADAAAAYRVQMLVYAMALERTWGRPPASLRLYFLRPELEFTVPFGPDDRQFAIDQVNQGIAALRCGQHAPGETARAPAARRKAEGRT